MSLRNGGNDVGVGVKGDRLEVRKSSIIFITFIITFTFMFRFTLGSCSKSGTKTWN